MVSHPALPLGVKEGLGWGFSGVSVGVGCELPPVLTLLVVLHLLRDVVRSAASHDAASLGHGYTPGPEPRHAFHTKTLRSRQEVCAGKKPSPHIVSVLLVLGLAYAAGERRAVCGRGRTARQRHAYTFDHFGFRGVILGPTGHAMWTPISVTTLVNIARPLAVSQPPKVRSVRRT